jgi:hypothetical protein
LTGWGFGGLARSGWGGGLGRRWRWGLSRVRCSRSSLCAAALIRWGVLGGVWSLNKGLEMFKGQYKISHDAGYTHWREGGQLKVKKRH